MDDTNPMEASRNLAGAALALGLALDIGAVGAG